MPEARFDIHVHLVGNGKGGSGCWLKLSGYHHLLGRYMLYTLGLPQSLLHDPGLDQAYVQYLFESVQKSPFDKVVLLAHERAYTADGKLINGFGSFYVPNEYLLSVCKQHTEFLPGVCIHPARVDALDELDKCIGSGAALLKLLPNCQNVDCSDERFIPFWEKLAKAKIPFLAHTGGELSVPVFDKRFADPSYLKLPLACGVKVIAAHCGTSSLPGEKDYFDVFASLCEQYPNLYGDNSGMQTPYRSKHFPRLLEPKLKERIVHGSDLPIPISGRWARMWGFISGEQLKAAHRDKNPLTRDYLIKRSMGFSEDTFTRAASILRLNQ